MTRMEIIPLRDVERFKSFLKNGTLTTTPEGRRIYNRLYLRLGDMKVVYNLIGVPPFKRRKSSVTLSEAEQTLVNAFLKGEVKTVREFASKYQNVTRILRRKYRYLSHALQTLLPSLYFHTNKQPIPREVVDEKLRKIVEKEGFVLVTDDGSTIPLTCRGAPPLSIQRAATFYYGSLLKAAESLNLPYRLYETTTTKERKLLEILNFIKTHQPTSIYNIMTQYGVSFAGQVYRVLRKLGKGDYRKGWRRVIMTSPRNFHRLINELKGGT